MSSHYSGRRTITEAAMGEVEASIGCMMHSTLLSFAGRLLIFGTLLLTVATATAQQEEANPAPAAFGEPGSLQVVSALGALTDSIPIVVSPGRRQMEPKIILSYNSSSGQGLLGPGWQLDLGRVEKWRGDGTPAAINTDSYSYSLVGAGGELVDTGAGVYRAKVERAYRTFKRNGDGWEMFNGEGIVHRFGSSSQNRIGRYRWLLDQVEDANGNTINYDYKNIGGKVLPWEIRYTGYRPGQDRGAHSVRFEYEDRPDIRSIYSGAPLREVVSKRLKSISIRANGALTRRYEFEYRQNELSRLSMLSRVVLVGADGNSRVTLRTMEYGTRTPGWGVGRTSSLPVDFADIEGRDTGGRILDVNGDNHADVIDGKEKQVWLGDGEGGFSRDTNWSSSYAQINVLLIDQNTADTGVRFTDVNSDGLPDIFIATPVRREVWLNTGKGWQLSPTWTASLELLRGPVRFDPDIPLPDDPTSCTPPHCNGEWGYFTGCTPLHCSDPESNLNNCAQEECDKDDQIEGCLPPECNFQPEFSEDFETEEALALVGEGGESQGVMLADVNGDGRVDVVWSMRSSMGLYYHLDRRPITVRAVYLNTGNGWLHHSGLSSALLGFDEFVEDGHVRGFQLMDVNGDGLSDIVRTRADQEEDERGVFLANGHGWEEDTGYTQSLFREEISSFAYVETDGEVRAQSRGLTPADLNDDGLVDYIIANEQEVEAFRNTGLEWVKDDSLAAPFRERDITFVENEGTESTGVVFANIDGDGLVDVIRARNEFRRIYFSSGMRSGLMAKTTNTLGETSTIDWSMSAALDNRDSSGIYRLPFNMPVVRAVHLHNGRGSTYTTSFEYQGGVFETRQFRGFKLSMEEQPSGLQIHTTHYQTPELSGQPKSHRTYDSRGTLLEEYFSVFELVDSGPRVKQVLPAGTEHRLHEAGTTRSTVIVYTYDAWMNPVSISKDPEVEVDGDETRLSLSWAFNEPVGFWRLPSRSTTYGAGGKKLTESVFTYDGLSEGKVVKGRVSRVRDYVEGSYYVTKTMEYDRYGNVIAYRDRTGQKYVFDYDSTATFRVAAVDPEGRQVLSDHDPRFGLETTTVDASGNRTIRYYDAFGRLETITLPGDEAAAIGTRSYWYSPVGDPGQQHFVLFETQSPDDPETLETVQFFDAMGKVYRVERTDAAGRTIVTTNEFDYKGNPVKISLPYFEGDAPRVSTITRDELYRPVHILDPDGHSTTLTYAGSRIDLVDRGGEKSSYWRNIDGDITQVTEWVGQEEQTTNYSYDALGRMYQVIDALGEETNITFDALGRRTRLFDPNIGDYQYRYDDAGRLIAQVDPGGETTTFRYNRAGDLLEKIFPDGSAVRYTYGGTGSVNGMGQIIRIDDDAGTVDISYDVRGNIIQRRRQVHGDTYVTGYAYDSLGRVRKLTYPDGFVVDYHYNSLSDIDHITDGDGQLIASDFEYNAARRLKGIRFGNEVSSRFSYGTMTQMNAIETTTDGGEILQELAYHHDSRGNILAIEDGLSQQAQAFEYDEAGRLLKAIGGYGERVYEYDAIGNLLRKNDMLFEMDPLHPQRVVKASQVEDTGAFTKRSFEIAYDLRGNVVSKSDQRFEYSAENRMTRILNAKGKVLEQNVYDAQGQRVIHQTRSEKTIYIDGVYERGQTHDSRHVYAGPMLVSTIVTPRSTVKLIDEAQPAFLGCVTPGACGGWALFLDQHSVTFGVGGALGALLVPCFFLPARIRRRVNREFKGTGQHVRSRPFESLVIALIIPVFLVVSSVPTAAAAVGNGPPHGAPNSEKRYYYHSNHLGSINLVTDERGVVIEQRDYTPYGERSGWTGPNSGPRELLMTFNGHRYDDASGLYYFGARYYDAELGRFLTADTLVSEPEDPSTLNRYAFANGNPIRFNDPTGHSFWDVVLGILVGAAALVLFALAVTVTVFSLGSMSWGAAFLIGLGATAVVALVAGVVGLGVGTGFIFWYAATAESTSLGGCLMAFVNGFLVGYVVTVGIAASIVALIPGTQGGWGILSAVILGALVGAGVGAVSTTVMHAIDGGGPDTLFWPLVSGIAYGGLLGGALGGVGSLFQSGLSTGFQLGAKGGKILGWVFAGLGSAVDLVDSFALPIALRLTVGYGYSAGGMFQAALSWGVHYPTKGITSLFGLDSSFMNSDPWQAFFGTPVPRDYFNPQPAAQ